MRVNYKKAYFLIAGVVATLFFLGFLYVYLSSSSTSTRGKYAEYIRSDTLYPVTRVVDGDTMVVDVGGHGVTLRLIGIDTPETVDPRKPVQCYGPEASSEAKQLLSGKQVYLEKDPAKGDYDKYGRVLVYLRLSDGLFYNEHMIEEGFAHEYTYFKEPYKYQTEFKKSEESAKKSHKGLWGMCSTAAVGG
jgi:micrococcal nuclease